jgi:phosphotransferase system HPr-like phosphotransfer protein
MEIEELISEKDRIINNLLEGIIDPSNYAGNLEDLTPAQLYRQQALKKFLENDWHHMDLEEFFNQALSIPQKGNESLLREKITNYYRDATELNKKLQESELVATSGFTGQEVLPTRVKLREIYLDDKRNGTQKFSELLDNAEEFNTLNYEFETLIGDLNRMELYNGIRHVMPESIEMRMLINYGQDYIDMLEALNRPSFNTNKFADLIYDRIIDPERLRSLNVENPYIPPNNIDELKELHQRFLQEFPKKAKEFVLGQNVYLNFNNRDAILGNDEFYQYTGMATSQGDMPSIQMSNNIQEIFEKFVRDEKSDYMFNKAQELGYEDANEWFDEVLKETEPDGPLTKMWDSSSSIGDDVATNRAAEKLQSYFGDKPIFNDFYIASEGQVPEFQMGQVLSDNPIYQAVDNPLDPNIGITVVETTTNVPTDIETLDIENYKPITIEVLDERGLHARPAGELVASFNNQGIPITILQDGNLKEVQMIGLLQQGKTQGETLDIYIPKDANINLDNVKGIKLVPIPTNVVDDINNLAINQSGRLTDIAEDTTTDLSEVVGKNGYKRFTQVAKDAPEIFNTILENSKKVVGKAFGIGGRAAQVLDPGDIVIEQSLVRMLPRLGLGAISVPALIAYVAYESTILLADVGRALNKARQKQGLGTVNETGGAIFGGINNLDDFKQLGKDTFQEMGEISDTWSLSWKISEPIIESVFKQSASMSQEK